MIFDKKNAPRRQHTWFVYALFDSRNPDETRYIGITNNPYKRMYRHFYDAAHSVTHKSNWISKVQYEGGIVLMRVLYYGLTYDDAKKIEIEEIALSDKLTNTTGGGDGSLGVSPTPEQRAAHSKRMSGSGNPNFGKPRDVEMCARISAKLSGKNNPQYGTKHSPEALEKMRKPKPAGHGAKVSAYRRMMPPTSGKYKGVSLSAGRWVAGIYLNGARKHLGSFGTEEAAALAYDEAAIAAWGYGNCYLNLAITQAA